MGEASAIPWTNGTWNPWHGCRKISPGCKNCYMFSEKARYGQDPTKVVRSKTTFNAPLKWADPRLIFTCSWSDWFIEEADEWREEARERVILATPQHTYQILTKRIERAALWIPATPDPHVWLGVSVEDRKHGLRRIDVLRELPAAVRFLSIEPQIEDLGKLNLDGIHWVIVGGESGPEARPFNLTWARDIIRQCKDAGVPVFMKQIGAAAEYFDPDGTHVFPEYRDRKGENPAEWPSDLRVREFPARATGDADA